MLDQPVSRKRALLLLAWVAAPALASCGVKARVASPAASEIGVASWYGHPYHGRTAANGEVFDMDKLTAAHRTLPFGTRVRVRNLDNSSIVEVRITDRGPFVGDRIIDLSRAAARDLGILGPGTAKVRLEVLSAPADATDAYAVQVGAFSDRGNAERLRGSMQRRYGSASLVPRQGDPVLWRVLVGRAPSLDAATDLARRIAAENSAAGGSPFVVRLD